jgi:hypothetical protein
LPVRVLARASWKRRRRWWIGERRSPRATWTLLVSGGLDADAAEHAIQAGPSGDPQAIGLLAMPFPGVSST